MNRKRLNFLFVLFFSTVNVWAQSLKITFPTEKMVFQRDASDQANITIAGTYDTKADKFEYRLILINKDKSTNWAPLDTAPSGGIFKGKINVPKGWYLLEIRQINNNQVVTQGSINNFGVGEVFLIAGQSNAQGVQDFTTYSPTDERIVAMVNNRYANLDNFTFPKFDRVSAQTNMGPTANTGWFWGDLGAKIAAKQDLPVMFINAAFEATSIEDWVESSKGNNRLNLYNNVPFPEGFPYSNFRNAAKAILPLIGCRSVIWLQGESDTHINTSFEKYLSSLKELIEISRATIGFDINWIVSRVSFGSYKTNQNIILAQSKIVDVSNNVTLGPNLDFIFDRIDGTHFSNRNHWLVADSFEPIFTKEYFSTAGSLSPVHPIDITAACVSNAGGTNLTVNANLNDIRINNESLKSKIVLSGTYVGSGIDSKGRKIFSYPVDFSTQNFKPGIPEISTISPLIGCYDATLKVKSNYSSGVSWSTGEKTSEITIKYPQTVSVTYTSGLGCNVKSKDFEVKSYAKIEPPKIFAAGPTQLCAGSTVTLAGDSFVNYEWSNGLRAPNIVVNQSGVFTAVKTESNGCKSASSLPVVIEVRPVPDEPAIQSSGSYTLSVTVPKDNQTFEWRLNDRIIGNNTANLKLTETGKYTAKAIQTYKIGDQSLQCISGVSNEFILHSFVINKGLAVYPNPVKDHLFSFDANFIFTNVYVEIFDDNGVNWYKSYYSNFDKPISLSLPNLKNGKYYLHVFGDGFNKTTPFIVLK